VSLAKCLQKEDSSSAPCEVLEHCSIMSPITALNKKLTEFYDGIKLGELLQPNPSSLKEVGK
jgi:Rrf2 family nitric oxide-sensitive transcriptional repressor